MFWLKNKTKLCFVVNIEKKLYCEYSTKQHPLAAWPLMFYCFNINQINQDDLGFEVLLHYYTKINSWLRLLWSKLLQTHPTNAHTLSNKS